MKTKLILIIVLLLNIADFVITLFIRPVLDEANPIMRMILYNDYLLAFVKLVIVPLFIFILIKLRDKWLVRIGSIGLLSLYSYAVVLGLLHLRFV
jgi:hypothetical protein